MTEPFNLDAIANEAEAKPFTFTFGGEQYELPAEVDVVAIAALGAGDYYGALVRLLGTKQFERLADSEAVLTRERFKALLAAYKKHTGVDLGESAASTGS